MATLYSFLAPPMLPPFKITSSFFPGGGRLRTVSGGGGGSNLRMMKMRNYVTRRSINSSNRVVCMAPEEEKMTRRSPLDFPIVFLMDPQWNPAVEREAQSRLHRIGQYKPIWSGKDLSLGEDLIYFPSSAQ